MARKRSIENKSDQNIEALDGVMRMVLNLRKQAKSDQNYALSDQIRNELEALGFQIKDNKEGSSWTL